METDLLSINKTLSEEKIILGSFPTWSLTSPDLEKGESEEGKRRTRKNNGDLTFYYGSSKNVFWSWYSTFFDPSVQPTDVNAIRYSLDNHEVGITNIIVRASRKGQSSFDYDLSKREYNYRFFTYPKPGRKLKILCTSKAVLNEMLLRSELWKLYPDLSVSEPLSEKLREEILQDIDSQETSTQSVCKVLTGATYETIECVTVPSPGSPFRGLAYFGKPSDMSSFQFLRYYLRNAFHWFKN